MATRTQSYDCGAGEMPLIGITIGKAFDKTVRKFPDREAYVSRHQGIRWTYLELKGKVDAFAAGLIALGLEPGDRIGIWSPNRIEWIVTQFATAKTGLILVNINPAYRLHELEYALNKSGCKAIITAAAFKTSRYLEMLQELCPELDGATPGDLHAKKIPALRTVIRMDAEKTPGMYNFDTVYGLGETAHSERLKALEERLQFDDPINIQFTSGTTGSPKGATLSHHNILNTANTCKASLRLTEKDRVCVPVPMYHCFGMVMCSLANTLAGATSIFSDNAYDPQTVLETVTEEKCTILHGVPTMFIAELEHSDFEKSDLRHLRTGFIGGAPCPLEVMKLILDRMNMKEITIAYGMTELSPVVTTTAPDDSLVRRTSTIGRAQPHQEVKIVDEDGRIVPVGRPGELCVRGYNVMIGYWDDPERTDEAIDKAGWMHTGDLAKMDAHGYMNIVGRIKDMVIRGGENLYPREIEEFLFQHPKIQDVQVFGIPSPKFGEELCAWIKLREGEIATEEEIHAFCEGKITHFKIPRYIRFKDSFPMTVTGKIQKFIMREQMSAELNLAETKTA